MTHACPKFDHCSAAICPVDNWRLHHHVKGGPVCFYLREVAKHGGTPLLMGDAPEELVTKAADAYGEIVSSPCSHFGDIRRRLMRAALSPSKTVASSLCF